MPQSLYVIPVYYLYESPLADFCWRKFLDLGATSMLLVHFELVYSYEAMQISDHSPWAAMFAEFRTSKIVQSWLAIARCVYNGVRTEWEVRKGKLNRADGKHARHIILTVQVAIRGNAMVLRVLPLINFGN